MTTKKPHGRGPGTCIIYTYIVINTPRTQMGLVFKQEAFAVKIINKKLNPNIVVSLVAAANLGPRGWLLRSFHGAGILDCLHTGLYLYHTWIAKRLYPGSLILSSCSGLVHQSLIIILLVRCPLLRNDDICLSSFISPPSLR